MGLGGEEVHRKEVCAVGAVPEDTVPHRLIIHQFLLCNVTFTLEEEAEHLGTLTGDRPEDGCLAEHILPIHVKVGLGK